MGRFSQKSIIHILPRLTKGGAETLVTNLLNDAVDEFNQVYLILASPNSDLKNLYQVNDRVKIIYLIKSYKSLFIVYFFLLFWIIKERKLIYSADIIHGHLTFGSIATSAIKILGPLFAPNRHKSVYVETYHAVGMPISRIKRWFHLLLFGQKNAIILVGDDLFWSGFIKRKPKLIIKIIRNGIRLPVLYNPISLSDKIKFRKKFNIPEECKFVIGTVSRLSPDRQPERFLKVFKELHNRLGSSAHFIFSGDGILGPKLKDLAQQLGVGEYIHFTGLAKDPYYTMQVLDVYVTLIAGQTMGLSGMEACAISKPVVAIQILNNYPSGASGWIWSSNDECEVANKICELISSQNLILQTSKEQYHQLSIKHSLSTLLEDYYLTYSSIIK